MMHIGTGRGKIILLGEHFVVHGAPALVGALSLSTIASVQKNYHGDLILYDHRPKVPKFIYTKEELYYRLIENIFEFMGVTDRSYTVTLSGDLPVTCGGIGASAATAVAVARALNKTFDFGFDDIKINQAALFGECAIHGTPSGVDNTAAVFGGVFVYHNGARRVINLKTPLEIVIADSGISTDTKFVIHEVKKLKSYDEGKIFDECHSRYEKICSLGVQACEFGDIGILGTAMNENHELLQVIGVSCSELDYMVNCARRAGALGAKVSGTGRGGIIIALVSGEQGIIVEDSLRQEGFFTLRTVLK
jgi:mevalonate kinase